MVYSVVNVLSVWHPKCRHTSKSEAHTVPSKSTRQALFSLKKWTCAVSYLGARVRGLVSKLKPTIWSLLFFSRRPWEFQLSSGGYPGSTLPLQSTV